MENKYSTIWKIYEISTILKTINLSFIQSLIHHLFTNIMVTVTEIAKNKIIELRAKDGLEGNLGVRVAVEGGGCSGLMYDLQFDGEQRPTDHVFEDKGIKVFVDKKSLLYLIGTELDFSDGLNGKGFQFKNPNATRTCGCGESFSV